jgi:hypothetical protein
MGDDEISFVGEGDHVRDFEFEVRPLEGVMTSVPLVGLMLKNRETGEERWYPLTPKEAEMLASKLVTVARTLPPPPCV